MDYIVIASIILTIVIIIAVFSSPKTNKIHKKRPVIVRPSYWITPTGPSWNPPIKEHYTQMPMKEFDKKNNITIFSNNNNTTVDHSLPGKFNDDMTKGNQTLNSALKLLGQ